MLVGYGRVGSLVDAALRAAGAPVLVVEEQDVSSNRRADSAEAILGSINQRGMFEAVNLAGARWLVSAIPNPFEAGNLFEAARQLNPDLRIVARAHSDAEEAHLRKFGAKFVVVGEREIARELVQFLLADGATRAKPDPPQPLWRGPAHFIRPQASADHDGPLRPGGSAVVLLVV